jgi:hypothetical protein
MPPRNAVGLKLHHDREAGAMREHYVSLATFLHSSAQRRQASAQR